MKNLLGLILVMGFFAAVIAIPSAQAITITQSPGRNEEQRPGRTVKKSDSNEPAKNKVKEKSQNSEKDKNADMAKEHRQQLQVLEEQMSADKEKWAERKVELERIKDNAAKAGNTKRAQLAGDLLVKEQQQYDHKQQQMGERRQKLLDLIKQDSPGEPNKPAK